MKVWSDVIVNVYQSLRDGQLINFQNDVWIRQDGPLINFFKWSGNLDNTLRVCNLVDESGNWDQHRLNSLVPYQILLQIAGLMPPSVDAGPDRLAWKWMKKDTYFMAKTYMNLFLCEAGDFPKVWKMIWKAKASQRARVLLWLLWQD